MYNLGVLLANQWDPPQLDQARTWYEKGRKEGPPHGTSAPGVTGLIAVMRRIDAARPAAQRGHATPAGRSPALDRTVGLTVELAGLKSEKELLLLGVKVSAGGDGRPVLGAVKIVRPWGAAS